MEEKDIAIIIPAYKEEKNLSRILPLGYETIICTTKECVKTIALARKNNARIAISGKGRSEQMNKGAGITKKKILVFMHADAKPPRDMAKSIVREVNKGYEAGCFRIRHDNSSLFYKVMDYLANLRARILRIYYGDQMIWCTKKAFEKAGGYPEEPILEDVIISKRFREQGIKTKVIDDCVVASSRRFEKNGRLKQLLVNQKIMLLYLLGVKPKKILRHYK